ncbi:cytochrome P450 52A12 [Pseudovirgaria hyperparasitica]|uniref:Cytochrome P450 52A12 n=1 Tax=Pseudovirgaria hyperparasitica TaxID=470096 RepID=A0A6A6W8F9_9PEZI|nr:cytochrome P450 52A12 [Pseudovirgaria hyperparasitica]KAF2758176.1 cytochrome P450 52A12 [Pseudovirgaria hyperparasitica]
MTYSLPRVTLYLSLAALIYTLTRTLLTTIYHRRRARALGCLPAYQFYENGIFGINNFLLPVKADREMRLPDFISESFHEASKRAGRWVGLWEFNILGQKGFHTIEPAVVKAVLGTQFEDFGLGSARCGSFKGLLGDGIFSSDGKQWQHSRALLRPQFARAQVADLDLEEKHLQHLLRAIPIESTGWTNAIDIAPLFFRLTLDSASEFLFGESTDSQLAALPSYPRPKTAALAESDFASAFDEAQRLLTLSSYAGDLYWLLQGPAFRKACAQCHTFIDHYVHKALTETPPDAPEQQRPDERYIFLRALVRDTRDPLELRHQLLSILLAGRDTTGGLLSWVFYLLVQHPDVFQKLRAEVLAHFGTYAAPRNITFAGLKGCGYLQHVLAETLRLHPSVPMNGRRCLRSTTIPTGGGPDGNAPVYVREGQEIIYTVYAMHRRVDLWGADANEFRPERWEGRKSGWEYLPFNGGPRICLGQQFALTEAGFVVVRLLQRFEGLEGVGVPKAGERVKHAVTLTSRPGEDVTVRFKVSSEKERDHDE